MPHINIKCYPGRSEEQKKQLAEKITQDIVEIFGTKESSVSVAIEDVLPENWTSDVVEKEVIPQRDFLYKKPGYLKD